MEASADPRVSIIIPAAAEPEHLAACLNSLEQHMPAGLAFEVIVLLNSRDDYRSVLAESAIRARAVAASTNLGLAGAGNRARAEARGEFLVLLHDDSRIEHGWIEALLDTATRVSRAGAIGGKVLTIEGELQSAGMILWRDGTTSAPWFGPPPAADGFAGARAVDYIGTSALMIRAATWDAVGGLDEQFFPVYYVDVDMAMKIRRNGQFVLYEPRSITRHHQGASGDLRWRHFVIGRNRQKFLRKWEAELQDHEVRVPESQEAIDRAGDRAEAFAARVKAGEVASGESPPAVEPFDEAAQERRALMMAVDLFEAYADALKAEAEAFEATAKSVYQELATIRGTVEELERAREANDEELIRLRKRDAELASIESLRWMRVYGTLHPLLRFIAKIIPR